MLDYIYNIIQYKARKQKNRLWVWYPENGVGVISSAAPENKKHSETFASVAQMAERPPCKRQVAGSSPVSGSRIQQEGCNENK